MRIGIIGGGISGLSAAYELRKRGHDVSLFEKAPDAGGLISTFDFDGITIEKFYHFLCRHDDGYTELCDELGIGDRVRWAPARTGFYYNGTLWPFTTPFDLLRFTPLTILERIRFGLFALEARTRNEWAQLDAIAAKPWLIDRIGRKAYEMIWHPLLAFKFGDFHERISAAWVWHRVHRVAKSKSTMGYLDGGSALLLDTLLARIRADGVVVREGCRVQRIRVGSDGVEGLELEDGSSFDCDVVVSAAPLSVVEKMLPEDSSEYRRQIADINYIGVVCAVYRLSRSVSPNFWLNIHDPRMACNGVIEFTNINPVAPDGESIVYVPYYVATDTPLYHEEDEAIHEQSLSYLKMVQPKLRDEDVIAWRVFRAPCAQAICTVNFLDACPPSHGGVDGLHLLDSVYQYPEDRTQSGLIVRARECAERIGDA